MIATTQEANCPQLSNTANNINKEPAKVYKKNNKADLILASPEPYNIITINNTGNTLSKNT